MPSKILLIEDDPLLVNIYGTKLKEAGFAVVFANNGEKAMHMIKTESPDLILLDLVLPHMDGWEVLEQMQEEEIKTRVLILSNLGQEEEIEKGFQLGAVQYLIKAHYTPSQVVEEIKNILSEE